MAHQAGFENVVASLGTALTPARSPADPVWQARGDGRGELSIALAYDVDAAGEKAGTLGAASLEELIRQLAATNRGGAGRRPRRPAPGGKDPDEVLRESRTAGARPSASPARSWSTCSTSTPTPTTSRRPAARPATQRRRSGSSGPAAAAPRPVRAADPAADRDRQGTLLEALQGQAPEATPGSRRGRRRRAGRAAGERDPAQRDPDRAGAAAARPAHPRVARPRARRGRAGPPAEPGRTRAVPGDRRGPRARRPGGAPAVLRRRDPRGLDEESRALGQALLSRPGPGATATSATATSPTRSSACPGARGHRMAGALRLQRDLTAEAERDGDRPSPSTGCCCERPLLNEQRRSLDRRRDQTRLLASPAVAGRRTSHRHPDPFRHPRHQVPGGHR